MFVLLLWLSTIVDWLVAARLFRERRVGWRRLLLGTSLLVNLGMLGLFKYGGFLLPECSRLLLLLDIRYQPPEMGWVLPVGSSFYRFQTLSYTLDVYLRRTDPERSFIDFALFVTFFSQLVAGPIVRPSQLLPQFKQPVWATRQQCTWGLLLLTMGLFEKVVLADSILSPIADKVFSSSRPVAFLDGWMATLAFSGQIFFDFAGYSLCAIGVAMMLGFSLPDNFRRPYAAVGFSDSWQRWHISLSAWLRDYLYIPLGGNHRGPRRTYVNFMLTMLPGGLWHGADRRFLVWGGVHGLYLMIERLLRHRFHNRRWTAHPLGVGLAGLATFAAVSVTWVLFRAATFTEAVHLLTSLVGGQTDGVRWLENFDLLLCSLVIAGMLASPWCMRNLRIEDLVSRTPWWLLAIVWSVMLILILLTRGESNALFYFQS